MATLEYLYAKLQRMKSQYEFYFDKEKTKKKLTKNALILLAALLLNFFVFFYLKSTLLTLISMAFVPVFFLYFSLRAWTEYNYTEPIILVDRSKIVLKKMNFLLKFIEIEIKIEDIKTIGTDIRMKGDSIVSEALSLIMNNSDKLKFQINEFELNHNDLYKIIKELNPTSNILNVGEFAYD